MGLRVVGSRDSPLTMLWFVHRRVFYLFVSSFDHCIAKTNKEYRILCISRCLFRPPTVSAFSRDSASCDPNSKILISRNLPSIDLLLTEMCHDGQPGSLRHIRRNISDPHLHVGISFKKKNWFCGRSLTPTLALLKMWSDFLQLVCSVLMFGGVLALFYELLKSKSSFTSYCSQPRL